MAGSFARPIASPKLHRRWRIVVLADLQTDYIGDYQRDVFRRVVEAKPDIVLLAGDYLQAPRSQSTELYNQLRELLHEPHLDATARVFAVRGNVEWDDWTEMFRGLNVTTVDATQSFTVDGLRLTCLGLKDSFDRGLTIPGDPRRFHLVLGHSPTFALGRIDADLSVAGHTHGGQVRLPLIGPVITFSRIPPRWAAGHTELSAGRRLLVSRGIGLERNGAPRIRFLCRPELVVLDLVPESK